MSDEIILRDGHLFIKKSVRFILNDILFPILITKKILSTFLAIKIAFYLFF